VAIIMDSEEAAGGTAGLETAVTEVKIGLGLSRTQIIAVAAMPSEGRATTIMTAL